MMKWSIAAKLTVGYGLLLGILGGSALIIASRMHSIIEEVRTITQNEVPTSAAAYEMEINTLETGIGILHYLKTAEPRYRQGVEKDGADFLRFKAQFDRLAHSAQEQEMGERVERLFREYRAVGERLMDAKDRESELLSMISGQLRVMEEIIDSRIQANLDPRRRFGMEKLLGSTEMEASLARMAASLGTYLHVPQGGDRQRVLANAEDFRQHLDTFRQLPLTRHEGAAAQDLETIFGEALATVEDLLALQVSMEAQLARARNLRVGIDDVLDDEIQVLTQQQLDAAGAAALRSIREARASVLGLLLLGLLLGGGAAALIGRNVGIPVRRLTEGATRFGRGEFDHRVEVNTTDELGVLAAAFNRMAEQRQQAEDELARSNAELESFAYVASHDLQEPLRKIQAFGDRLKSRYGAELGEQGQDYLERMQSAAARMQTLINDLLALSRVRTRGQAFTPVELAAVASEVVSDLEVRIQETGAQVEIGELPVLAVDALQMRLLFQNLISNALKFRRSDAPPMIRVYSTPVELNGSAPGQTPGEPNAYRIVVEDNGIGFNEEYNQRIFLPFQRLHGRGEYEGTGMGLAICQKIAGRHGGSITARSVPGKGSTFLVILPVRLAAATRRTVPVTAIPTTGAGVS